MKTFNLDIITILSHDLYFADHEYDGKGFYEPISPEFASTLKPQWQKSEEAKEARKKYKAEVMTPTSIINKMNSKVTDDNILYKTVCESCCGECPYIANVYDVTTGKNIPLEERCGLLDMKLRLCEPTEDEFLHQLSMCYGYEWQGDNLFIGRKQILEDFVEWYNHRISEIVPHETIIRAANIIVENFVQLDGLSFEKPKEK